MATADQVQSLAKLAEPVVTLFLNTENPNPSRHPKVPANLVWLRRYKAALEQGMPAPDAKDFDKVFSRVHEFLEGRHPQEKALALFAGPNTWTVIPLEIPVHNELRWGKPSVGQLVRLLGEHERYGVAVVDHKTARFFQFHVGEFTSLGEKRYAVDESQWKRSDVGHIAGEQMRKGHGPDRDLYNHRLNAQYERLWQETADQAALLQKKHGLAGIFLVGPERLVSSIHKHLTGGSVVHVIEVFEDLGEFSPKEIRERIEPLIASLEQTLRLAEVRELLASESGSVLDPDEALAKLQAGAIRTLFVAEAHELYLRECAKCRAVNRSGGTLCGDCGGQRQDVTTLDALSRLAAAHGTELRFVTGVASELLAKAGGLAGRLRQQRKTAVG